MPEIDRWSECLSEEMRAVWPTLAAATRGLDGSLVGGTALAIDLRHRPSFDLDFMTLGSFSGERVARSLRSSTEDVVVSSVGVDTVHAAVRGIEVQVFRAPARGSGPGHVRNLAAPSHVDGLAVASLADLLASKLDVIMYRPKLRDYVDLAAIDSAGPYRLEDGLLFHTRRYRSPPPATDLARIVALLEDPGPLQTDRTFDALAAPTLEYLRGRVPALQRHLQSLRAASPAPPVERSTGRAPVGPISSPDDVPPCAPGPSGPDV